MRTTLYIGHHKVGSTTLQAFLAMNSHALLRDGILYPFVEMEGLAYAVAKAMQGGDDTELPPINVREPHNGLALRMISEVSPAKVPAYRKNLPHSRQMFLAIEQQVQRLQPRQMILCAEVLSSFGAIKPGLIEPLVDSLPPAECEVYCVLRRPDEYLVSWHGQRLKYTKGLAALRDGAAVSYFSSFHFDYRKVVDPWMKHCRATFRWRNYAEVMAAGGSVEDFFATTGTAPPARPIQPENRNISLPYALIEIGRRAMEALPRSEAQNLRKFLLLAPPQLDLPANREVEMFGPELRARMLKAFRPVHDHLSKVARTAAFFPDFEEIGRTRPLDEREVTRAVLEKLTPDLTDMLAAQPARDFLVQLRRESGFGRRIRRLPSWLKRSRDSICPRPLRPRNSLPCRG